MWLQSTAAWAQVWDSKTLQCLKTLEGHEDNVRVLAVGQRYLFSGSWDKTIRVWDLQALAFVKVGSACCGQGGTLMSRRALQSACGGGGNTPARALWEHEPASKRCAGLPASGLLACCACRRPHRHARPGPGEPIGVAQQPGLQLDRLGQLVVAAAGGRRAPRQLSAGARRLPCSSQSCFKVGCVMR